eukprot:759222_1
MAAFFVSCFVWIVCSQAITSTDQPSLVVNYHANHSPKCNSHTLLSTNPDAIYAGAYYTNDNVSAIVELIDCHKPCFHPSVVQFSSLFSKTHVQKDVEYDDQSNAISSYEPKSINFTAPFLPLSSKKQIEKWVDSIVADCIDANSMLNDIIDTHTPLPNYQHEHPSRLFTTHSNRTHYNSYNYIQTICTLAATLFGVFVSQSRPLQLCLFISFNLLISVHAQYFNCTGWAACKHHDLVCDQGNATINCTIDCIEPNSCSYANIYGGAGPLFLDCIGTSSCSTANIYGGVAPMFLNCHGEGSCRSADIYTANTTTLIDAQGDYSLKWSDIWCNTTEYCNITVQGTEALEYAFIYADVVNGTKLYVNATGEMTLKYTDIACPIDHIPGDRYSNDALCNIYAQGENVMFGTNIYAVESFHNVKIECDLNRTGPTYEYPVLFCGKHLDEPCALECPQNDIDFLDPNCFCVDYTIPSPAPTHNPTMLPTTSSPTFSPTKYDPEEEPPNTLYVSKNGCDAGPCDSDRFNSSTYAPSCS